MDYILTALFSYLLGSIPTALIVVFALSGRDVRSGGSGNMGAMNTVRMLKKYKGLGFAAVGFLIVWISDMVKAIAAVWIAQHLIGNFVIAVSLATGFAILGHNYPVFLKFRGGKGAASFMGVLLYFNPLAFVLWILTIFAGVLLFEMVELTVRKKSLTLKGVFHAISEQILGRLAGEIMAVYTVYLIDPRLLWPTVIGSALIIVSHHKRLRNQLAHLTSGHLSS